jgi:integrase
VTIYKNASGIYELDLRRKGFRRVRLSLRTPRKAEARAREQAVLRLVRERRTTQLDDLTAGRLTIEEITAAVEDGRSLATVGPQVEWPTVAEAVETYLAWLAVNPNRAKKTRQTAQSQLRAFRDFGLADGTTLGARRVDAVTTAMTSAYQAALLQTAAPNTVVHWMDRVGTLYRWLERQELRQAREAKRPPRALHVPIDSETKARTRTRRDVFLTEADAERLLAATPPALAFAVAAGLFAGLRIEEMLHLRTGYDVDLRTGLLLIQPQPEWTPKNGKRREVPIAPPLRPLIERQLAKFASETHLVPSEAFLERPMSHTRFDAAFRQIVQDAGLPSGRKDPKGIVYHTLRHTFASWLVMRGVDLYTVAQLLGNSLKMVETVYAHLAPDFRQRAVDRLAGAITLPPLED